MSRLRKLLLMLLSALLLGALTVSTVSAHDDDDDELLFPSSLIVFTSVNRSGSTGGDLWLIDPNDPTRLTQLTATPEDDQLPIWSPEGSQIFFKRHRPTEESLWVIGADGTGERQILDYMPIGSGGFAPLFWYFGDPAGARVYYYQVPGSPDSFRWIYADGPPSQMQHPVSGADTKVQAYISPDQRELVFTNPGAGQNLEKADLSADGKSVSNIDPVFFPLPAGQIEISEPNWSPDGSRVAFAMDPGGFPTIHTIASSGSGLVQIANLRSTSPTWSPDGEWLTFAATAGTPDIYIAPADAPFTPLINLTNDGIPDGQPDWSPELDEDLIEDIFGDDDDGGLSSESLLAYWPFDEGSGAIAQDVTGNGNDGTVNGASYVEGVFGSALEFERTSAIAGDFVETPFRILGFGQDTELTITLWFRTSSADVQDFMGYFAGPGADIFTPRLLPPNHTTIGMRSIQPFRRKTVEGESCAAMNDGEWHHVAYTHNAAGEFDIYLDGLLLEEVILADDVLFSFDQTTNWYLGAVNDTFDNRPSNPFDGTLDEIKIYGSTLTAEEIAEEAEQGDVDGIECPDLDDDDDDGDEVDDDD